MDRWKAIALVLGGILVGTLFAGPGPSMADSHSSFKECVWYGGIDFKRRASKLDAGATAIPAGWSVVTGAGGGGDVLAALLCR